MRFTRSAAITVTAAAFLAATGCENTRSITTDHVGPLGFGINMTKQSSNIAAGFIRIPPSPLATTNPANDSVRIHLTGIDSLATGTYTVWFANDSATKFALVTSGSLQIIQTDSSISAAGDRVVVANTSNRTGVANWRAGGSNKRMIFRTSRASATGFAASDSLNVVIVSIETGAPGAAPNADRVLWLRRSERIGTSDSGQVRFGTFKPRVAEQYLFTQNSAMTITPRGRIEVRGPIMVVNDSNYLRPPANYYYAAFAIKLDSLNKIVDTVYLGRRTSPYPKYIPLYTADKVNPDPDNVFDIPPVIYAMGTRVSADSVPEAKNGNLYWRDFAIVNVTLESKYGIEGRMGANVVMTAALPQSVRGR